MNERAKFVRVLMVLWFIVLGPEVARGTVFWEADTNRGLAVFPILDLAPGTVSVAPDPLGQFGNVYKFFLPDTNSAFGKERCESSGTETPTNEFRVSYNTDYYIGWRAMWNPMPVNGSWVALFQMHGYGVSGQGAPLVLRCVNGDGNLYMQNNANGVDTNFWHTKFVTNVWQSFVLHVFMSTNFTQGYIEIWYNGVLQTNNAGTTRWYGPTWDNVDGVWADSYNKLKWGCYRSGSLDGHGDATAYMSSAKVGSTFADVDPDSGGAGFSMTTSPGSESVLQGKSTNYTVTVSASGGFATNVNLSARGLPPGANVSFKPLAITNSGSSTMTISTSAGTPVGSYTVSVIGTSGTLGQTNTVSLVVSQPVTPVAMGLALSGGGLVCSGSNGVPLRSYYVLASTNLGLPLTNWTVVATNAFDGSGNFSFTNRPGTNVAQMFYVMRLE